MGERTDGQDRRAQILAVTAEALLEQGLRATTTRNIAGRIGVGAGLINHYFAFADLRAEAFVVAFRAATAQPDRADAKVALEEFFDFAFDPQADGLWRMWIEAVEMAATDPAMRRALAECSGVALTELTEVIAQGDGQGCWQVSDSGAVALRLMALHEGLIGLVLSGMLPLSRGDAAGHLRAVFALHHIRG